MLSSARFVAAISLILLSASAQAEVLKGLAHTITDGDTIIVSDGIQSHRIRLNGIDAPELSQPAGKEAREALRRVIENQPVIVIWSKRDRYGRVIGTVTFGAADLGITMLYQGWAWYFKQYESDIPEIERVLYQEAETSARDRKVGLWKADNPQPPWEARHPETVSEKVIPASSIPNNSPPAPTPGYVPQPKTTVTYEPPARQTSSYSRGPRGGCYYMRGSRKVYVDRSLCN